MGGTQVEIGWQGRRARAWVPEPTRTLSLPFAAETASRTELAAAATRRAAQLVPASSQPWARLAVRAEGLASSDIEGLRAPVALVAAAEVDDAARGTAASIADTVAVIDAAITEAPRARLTIDALHRWHTRLMRHGSRPPRSVGRFRTAHGWVGGTSPLDAAFVAPPPKRVHDLVEDVVWFANRDDLDPVAQAAVLHAQFETIRPYGEGSGQLGRVLIAWTLVRRLGVSVPPPISIGFARDPDGYHAGLDQFRTGASEDWVRWFADTLARSGDAMVAFVNRTREINARWSELTADLRSDAAARAIVGVLCEHPVMHAEHAARVVGVSDRSARAALRTLADRGILEPLAVDRTARGRPHHWWVAREVLETVAR